MLSAVVLLPIPVLCYHIGYVVWMEWKRWGADHDELRLAQIQSETEMADAAGQPGFEAWNSNTKSEGQGAVTMTVHSGGSDAESTVFDEPDVAPMDNVGANMQTLSVPQSGNAERRTARESEEWSIEISGLSGGDRSGSM